MADEHEYTLRAATIGTEATLWVICSCGWEHELPDASATMESLNQVCAEHNPWPWPWLRTPIDECPNRPHRGPEGRMRTCLSVDYVVVYLPEKDAFMDISLDQINRPHKGIDFPPMVMSGRPDDTLSFVDDNGAAIIYYPDPPGRFLRSPNWRGVSRNSREPFKDVTGRAIRAIRKELG